MSKVSAFLHTLLRIRTHIFFQKLEYRNSCFDTVEPSSARLPPAHRIILPCVKTYLRIWTHIFIQTLLSIGTLVLTQWNHHRLDYLRPTGLFCLVSKVSAFLHTLLRIRTHIFFQKLEYRNSCFDTVEPSSARLPPAHRIILPCVKSQCFLPLIFKNRNIYLHPDTVAYRNTCFDTVEPSSARLPLAHRIILPCVKGLCFPPHIVKNINTYLHPVTDEYRVTSFDTVEPSSARLPPAHRIILPCVKSQYFPPHIVENMNISWSSHCWE